MFLPLIDFLGHQVSLLRKNLRSRSRFVRATYWDFKTSLILLERPSRIYLLYAVGRNTGQLNKSHIAFSRRQPLVPPSSNKIRILLIKWGSREALSFKVQICHPPNSGTEISGMPLCLLLYEVSGGAFE